MFHKHKVGQYYFLNFPKISLIEWHPFSVSSGPREMSCEIHIAALGDHTREVVALAKECGQSGESVWLRYDGPYGVHDFNFRRYPVNFMVGGGVGVTPVMGILKDLYNVGDYSRAERRSILPHNIEAVYVIWVCRQKDDFLLFEHELLQCMNMSTLPQFPNLITWVHISRAPKDEELPFPLLHGRPNIPSVMETIHGSHPKQAWNAFTCGPGAMVNEIWDTSIRLTKEQHASIDFHHETFEF
jgi:respiratory burst oxidase